MRPLRPSTANTAQHQEERGAELCVGGAAACWRSLSATSHGARRGAAIPLLVISLVSSVFVDRFFTTFGILFCKRNPI